MSQGKKTSFPERTGSGNPSELQARFDDVPQARATETVQPAFEEAEQRLASNLSRYHHGLYVGHKTARLT